MAEFSNVDVIFFFQNNIFEYDAQAISKTFEYCVMKF